MTKVHNPGAVSLVATVFGEEYEIPAGGSVDVKDARAATSLVEYGAKIESREEYEAALDAAADRARELNAGSASASASEGEILSRQATVDVESGGVTGGASPDAANELRGAELDAALDDAGLVKTGTADEKRERVRAFRAGEIDVNGDPVTAGGEFLVDEAGDVVLDDDGNPVPNPDHASPA